MSEQLRSRLSSVRSRQHRLVRWRYAALGLLIGSIFGLCLAVARMQGGAVAPIGAVLTAVGGAIAGLAIGWFRVPSWKESAKAVDAHYQLKDRSSTALDFAADPEATDLQVLQVRDAVEHLNDVSAQEVVPYRIPRLLPVAAVVFVAAAGLALIPLASDSANAKLVEPLENIVTEAELLEETMLDELKEIAAQTKDDPQLEQLVTELQEMVDEMKEPGVDEREALAKLSEMQAAVAAVQAEFNMDIVDANMQAMGEAMSPAMAMKAAAHALQEGEYKKAADQLEQIDSSAISRKEAKTVAKELAKLSKGMADAGLGQLSEATSEYCEGLSSGDGGKSKSGARKLARLARKYALRKSVGMCLNCQLARLAEAKCNCNKSGGLARNKQGRPSNNWGRGSTGNPFGEDATQIDSTRRQEQITGVAGEGPSEREVTHSPEGREVATRQQREVYKEYRKRAEEVLQSEALPLGHRQTIRQYFESIRPDNGDDSETSEAE